MDNPKSLSAYEVKAILDRNPIHAIKLYVQRTGADLREARDLVESYGDANGLREDGPCIYCCGSGKGRSWKR